MPIVAIITLPYYVEGAQARVLIRGEGGGGGGGDRGLKPPQFLFLDQKKLCWRTIAAELTITPAMSGFHDRIFSTRKQCLLPMF